MPAREAPVAPVKPEARRAAGGLPRISPCLSWPSVAAGSRAIKTAYRRRLDPEYEPPRDGWIGPERMATPRSRR